MHRGDSWSSSSWWSFSVSPYSTTVVILIFRRLQPFISPRESLSVCPLSCGMAHPAHFIVWSGLVGSHMILWSSRFLGIRPTGSFLWITWQREALVHLYQTEFSSRDVYTATNCMRCALQSKWSSRCIWSKTPLS